MEKKQFGTKLSMIRYFLKGTVWIFLISMVFAAMVSFFDMVLPRIMTFTVDSVIGEAAPDLPAFAQGMLASIGGVEALRERPYLIALLVAAVAGVGAVCRYLFRVLNEAAAERFVKRMPSLSEPVKGYPLQPDSYIQERDLRDTSLTL